MKALARKQILELKPYSSARDEFLGQAQVYLDANENPFEGDYNRYPDPLQRRLRSGLAAYYGSTGEQTILGNGSDELIDLLIRAYGEPRLDNVIQCSPTYGMYKVWADVNGVEVLDVPLDEKFEPSPSEIMLQVNDRSKILFLCSPNNPTGNTIAPSIIAELCESFSGLVVVDEAYQDFTNKPSGTSLLGDFENLVVLKTMSKAWGLAGIRLGVCFASEEVIGILDKVRSPYNVSDCAAEEALIALSDPTRVQGQVAIIVDERERLFKELSSLPIVDTVFPSDANFLLVRVKDADSLYERLVTDGIVVRNRSKVQGCENCLRITVGTSSENDLLIKQLNTYCYEESAVY